MPLFSWCCVHPCNPWLHLPKLLLNLVNLATELHQQRFSFELAGQDFILSLRILADESEIVVVAF